MYNYNAYNLGICSALPLPELESSAGVIADVSIELGHIDWSPRFDSACDDEPRFECDGNVAYFFWSVVGKFSVTNGSRIVVDPIDGVEERLIRLPLLGAVLATLLHQRGYLVLHASAVSIADGAVLFLGQKGQGKSTTAATLFGLGHKMIADDIVALSITETGRPAAAPGYPQFKLYPEAAAQSLGDNPKVLVQLADGYEKYGRRVNERFAKRNVPLDRIYVLRHGPRAKVTRLDPQAALLALISNSYVARFGKQLLSGEQASLHLQQCARVMRNASMYLLERPNSLTDLHSIARLIETTDNLPSPIMSQTALQLV